MPPYFVWCILISGQKVVENKATWANSVYRHCSVSSEQGELATMMTKYFL